MTRFQSKFQKKTGPAIERGGHLRYLNKRNTRYKALSQFIFWRKSCPVCPSNSTEYLVVRSTSPAASTTDSDCGSSILHTSIHLSIHPPAHALIHSPKKEASLRLVHYPRRKDLQFSIQYTVYGIRYTVYGIRYTHNRSVLWNFGKPSESSKRTN